MVFNHCMVKQEKVDIILDIFVGAPREAYRPAKIKYDMRPKFKRPNKTFEAYRPKQIKYDMGPKFESPDKTFITLYNSTQETPTELSFSGIYTKFRDEKMRLVPALLRQPKPNVLQTEQQRNVVVFCRWRQTKGYEQM